MAQARLDPGDDRLLGVWYVAEGGYRWKELPLEEHAKPEPCLVPARSHGLAHRTWPLRDAPTLCRTFAALDEHDPGALRAFANEHGPLGVEPTSDVGLIAARIEGGAEPLSLWRAAILDVREALELLDAAQAPHLPATVAQRIDWRTSPPRVHFSGLRHRRMLRLEPRPSRHGRAGFHLRWCDFHHAARVFAQQLVNAALERHSMGRLLWNPGFRFSDPTTGDQSFPCPEGFELRIYPTSLLGILWVQVGQAAEGRVHRRCAACGGWFSVGKESHRSNKRTCSPACRQRVSRAKRSRARKK